MNTTPPPPNPPERRSPSRGFLVWLLVVLVFVAILTGGTLYFVRSILEIPGKTVDAGRELLEDVRSVAAAFRQGTVETSFRGYLVSLEGTSRLQIATLEQMETFDLRDRAALFWGELELPEVVVEVSAPVEYTYFVDLEGDWRIEQVGHVVQLLAPAIDNNRPAVNPSEIEYRVRESSLLRDEQPALDELKNRFAELAERRARDHLPLVRETARMEVEAFVRTWLLHSFSDGADVAVVVRFADEDRPRSPVLDRLREIPANG
ncbi:MAG: hypothetical protein AAF481_11400 [Acidobacteriota bacterium]